MSSCVALGSSANAPDVLSAQPHKETCIFLQHSLTAKNPSFGFAALRTFIYLLQVLRHECFGEIGGIFMKINMIQCRIAKINIIVCNYKMYSYQ
jgi:hypothetical protein